MELPAALAWLLGEWEGDGRGGYPSVADFTYREHTVFTQPRRDKPFLAYSQQTWLADGSPSHAETGYLRLLSNGRVDFVIAQPAGRAEVHEGTAIDDRIELASVVVACAPTANMVTEVRRVIEHQGRDTLWYQLDMAATGHALGYHCEATLHRVR